MEYRTIYDPCSNMWSNLHLITSTVEESAFLSKLINIELELVQCSHMDKQLGIESDRTLARNPDFFRLTKDSIKSSHNGYPFSTKDVPRLLKQLKSKGLVYLYRDKRDTGHLFIKINEIVFNSIYQSEATFMKVWNSQPKRITK